MADVGTLIMKIKADTSGFDKGINRTNESLKKIGKVAVVAGAAVATGLAVAGKKAIELGSDAEEMLNKYNVVFDGMTQDVDDWAENFSKKVGRSKFDVQKAVSNLGDLQQGLGMTKKESFELSSQIVELATDLASFNNVQDEQAIEAISKAMMGEAESAKQLGLLLNVDRVKQYAESQGLVYEELTDAQRAQQVYNLALEQSQNAIGDAERSSGSFENQMKKLKSTLKDSTTELGMKLLPTATKFLTWINNTIPKLNEIKESIIGAFVDATKPAIDYINQLAEDFKMGIDVIKGAFEDGVSIANFFWRLEENMEESGTAFGRFVGHVSGEFAKLTEFFESSVTPMVQDFITTLQSTFVALVGVVSNQLPTIKQVFKDVFEEGKRRAKVLIDFFNDNVMPAIQRVIEIVMDRLPLWGDIFKRAFTLAWDVSKTLFNFFKDNILPIIGELIEFVVANMPAFEETVRTVFTAVVTAAEGAWAFFKDYILPIIESLLEVAEDVFPKVLEQVKPVFEKIVQLGTTLWVFFEDHLLPIIKKIFEKVDEYIPLLSPIFETVFGAISTVIGGIIDEIKEFIDWVDDAVEATKKFFSAENTASQQATEDFITSRAGQYNSANVSGQRANGGPVMAGKTYLVGERGSEFFTPSKSGYITNGGTGITVNVYALDPNEAAAQTVEALHLQGVGQ